MLPREAGSFVARNAKHVTIDKSAVLKLADRIANDMKAKGVAKASWNSLPYHPSLVKTSNSALHAFLQRNQGKLHTKLTYEEAVANWVFVLDTLNFSFWPACGLPKYKVNLDGQDHTGHFALVSTIERALRNDVPIIDAKWCAEVTYDKLRELFTSESGIEMAMLSERLQSLNANGLALLQKFSGSFLNCIKQANRSAQRLLELLTNEFEQFRDQAKFQGETVAFHKRAQILIADCEQALIPSDSATLFDDSVEFLTAFADYRVPQILHYFSVLHYSSELLDLLQSRKELPNGSAEEVEIRGCTIHACELLRDAVREHLKTHGEAAGQLAQLVGAAAIDNYLWFLRREIASQIEAASPFHRTRTIYY